MPERPLKKPKTNIEENTKIIKEAPNIEITPKRRQLKISDDYSELQNKTKTKIKIDVGIKVPEIKNKTLPPVNKEKIKEQIKEQLPKLEIKEPPKLEKKKSEREVPKEETKRKEVKVDKSVKKIDKVDVKTDKKIVSKKVDAKKAQKTGKIKKTTSKEKPVSTEGIIFPAYYPNFKKAKSDTCKKHGEIFMSQFKERKLWAMKSK